MWISLCLSYLEFVHLPECVVSYLSSNLGKLQPGSCSYTNYKQAQLHQPLPLCMLQPWSLPTGSGRACHLQATERETKPQGGAVTACPSIGSFCDIVHHPPHTGCWTRAEESRAMSQVLWILQEVHSPSYPLSPDGRGEAKVVVFLSPTLNPWQICHLPTIFRKCKSPS